MLRSFGIVIFHELFNMFLLINMHSFIDGGKERIWDHHHSNMTQMCP